MSTYRDYHKNKSDFVAGTLQKAQDYKGNSITASKYLGGDYGVYVDRTLYPELADNVISRAAVLQQEINNPSPVANDYFGWSVSIYGDTCIIGVRNEDTGADDAGSAYVFTRSDTTWSLEQEIHNPTPEIDERFGVSVAIYGDTCIIGAPYENTGESDAGSAYVYTRSGTTWTLEQTINNPSPTASDLFGSSVAIYGDTCIIGAFLEDTGEDNAGSAYVYTRSGTTWSLEQEIHNPSPTASDDFGYSVSIYGDTCIIGAYLEDTGEDNAGSVYIYTRSGTTWSLEQEIHNPSPTADDRFGCSVSIYGDTCIIGAYGEDTGGSAAGSIYIYTRSGTTWSLQQEIHNPYPEANDYFGWSVSIYGDTCIIGAPYENTGESGAGSAYVYTRSGTTWTLEQEIHNPSPTADDQFGGSVSIYGDNCIISAHSEDTGADSAGSAYIYVSAETDSFQIQTTDQILNLKGV